MELCLLWRRAFLALMFVALSGGMYAADGVVGIDQTRALAGNVTPGDAPGFPVTISESGSYRLTGNLTVPDLDTTAIQITADSVMLDLNGFSILGLGVCTGGPATICPALGKGVGVRAGGDKGPGPRAVRIRNGSVRGMGQFGIWMTGDGSFVENVTVDGNIGGGMTVAGSVIQSTATRNGAFGIIALTVHDSAAVQNLGDGILLDAGGVATGNVASGNGGYGIVSSFGTASGNTVSFNKSFGISAFCPSSIVGNTAVANEGGSIQTKGNGCAVVNNATRP